MDPKTLIDTSLAIGLPVPAWFIELFRALGFTLHEVPMNLWYAGIVVAMVFYRVGGVHARRFSSRLMSQMPVIIALGVNFGIVPLLFIQVGYGQIFYPATILMAWFWLGVVALLIPAYYGIYIYASGLGREGDSMAPIKRFVGWASAVCFIAIGFIFSNALSLMENVPSWSELWLRHSFHGAALGTALNLTDVRLVPRWLLMFGLALTTTGVWIAVDSAWFARGESADYRSWARRYAFRVHTLGALWFGVAGAWYSLCTWSPRTIREMFLGGWAVLTVVTALSVLGPWLLLRRKGEIGRPRAALIGLAQLLVLGLNAVSRQVVQRHEIRPYYDLATQATDVQWGPLVGFLAAFGVGIAVVGWLIMQVARLPDGGRTFRRVRQAGDGSWEGAFRQANGGRRGHPPLRSPPAGLWLEVIQGRQV
ncbi:MAG: hypothetical protein HY815_31730 [Candidatus Riflebacteria bacterium]|nr:hypothetical protein [Candidatus Riflebacteria bacterium]